MGKHSSPQQHHHHHCHGHSHSADPWLPKRPVEPWHKANIILVIGLIISFLITLCGVIYIWPRGEALPVAESFSNTARLARNQVTGTVTHVDQGLCSSPDVNRVFDGSPRFSQTSLECSRAIVELTSGENEGRNTLLFSNNQPGEPQLAEGDKIILSQEQTSNSTVGYTFADYQRGTSLTVWLVLTIAAFILIGGKQGVRSLLGVLIGIIGVFVLLIPGLLHGNDPLLLAVITGSIILFPALYIVHGIHWKTSAALAGTLIALVLSALLGTFAISSSSLQGLGDDSFVLITRYIPDIPIQGLMLAGFIIGALGVLNDTTVSQASTVNELSQLDPHASRRTLFTQAMKVGRDHIASMIYTLVFSYAGAALPLLLLVSLSGQSMTQILSSDIIATELLRSAVGAIALVFAVPLTTFIAAITVKEK